MDGCERQSGRRDDKGERGVAEVAEWREDEWSTTKTASRRYTMQEVDVRAIIHARGENTAR